MVKHTQKIRRLLPMIKLSWKNLYNELYWELTSLDSRDIPQRIQKHISDQNLFSWFQLWWWTVVQKIKSKDQGILEILYVKTSNMIGRMNFEFWGQNSRTRQLNCLKYLNQFAVLWTAYHMQKISTIAQLSLDILKIK